MFVFTFFVAQESLLSYNGFLPMRHWSIDDGVIVVVECHRRVFLYRTLVPITCFSLPGTSSVLRLRSCLGRVLGTWPSAVYVPFYVVVI